MLGFIIPFCFCQTSEPRATWGRRMRIRTHIGAHSSSGSGASCRDARPHYWPSELNIMNFSPNLITGTFNEYYLSITKVHITVYWRSNLLSNVTFAVGQELFCIKVFGPPSFSLDEFCKYLVIVDCGQKSRWQDPPQPLIKPSQQKLLYIF